MQHLYFRKYFLFFLLSGMVFQVYADNDTTSITKSLDEVVVSATKVQVSRNSVPLTISVVGRDRIEESRESALLPILAKRVPGMFVSERGITGFGVAAGAAGGISIRGIGGAPNTQVLVLIDGHPQFMGLMGHPLPDAYIASDVESVEVIRGPGSILYGTNAMGGVINIITRKQKREGWDLNSRVMLGSYNTQKYMGNAGVKKGKVNFFASVNHDRTDGHRENSAFKITNSFMNLNYEISEHLNLKTNLSIAKYNAENPGVISRPLIGSEADILRGMGAMSIENHCGEMNGAFSLFYNWGDHAVNEGYNEGGKPLDYRFRSNDRNYGLMFYQSYKLFEGNNTTAGLDYKSYGGHAWNSFSNGFPDVNLADTSMCEFAAYAISQQILFTNFTLSAGLRIDYNKIVGRQLIPQIGVTYKLSRNSVLKASASKGFRNPSVREMFIFGANPFLKPESMDNYDLSISQGLWKNRLRIELTGYILNGKNLIKLQNTDGKLINVNTGEFYNKGIEASVDFSLSKFLSFTGNYSFLEMDTPVLNAPRQQAFLSVNYQFKRVSTSLGYQIVDKLYLVSGNSPITKSYTLLDAKFAYQLFQYVNIFVKGENLMNRDYQVLNGYPMPKATVFVGVHVHLGK